MIKIYLTALKSLHFLLRKQKPKSLIYITLHDYMT